MAKRTGLSKKVRFEVFKRDSFTCQYCGKKAPEVVLVVDHIHPVAKGGKNDLLNLVTSCEECNQGKSDRTLDDSSVVAKRNAQASALQNRREQIEMIAEWQRGLANLEEAALQEVTRYYHELVPGWSLKESGVSQLRPYVAKHGISEVMSCMRKAAGQHVRLKEDGMATEESSGIVFRVIVGTLKYKEANERDPEGCGARYAAAIARNRLAYVPWNHRQVFIDWARDGVPVDVLKDAAAHSHSWSRLCDNIEAYISERQNVG